MNICLSHSHSLGTNLKHFASSLNLQKKKKAFQKMPCKFLSSWQLYALSLRWGNISHLWSTQGLSRHLNVILYYGRYAMQLASSYCYGDCCIVVTVVEFTQFSYKSKLSRPFRDAWHFPRWCNSYMKMTSVHASASSKLEHEVGS